MGQQNYDNHVRWSIPYHFITIPLIIIGNFIAVYHYWNDSTLTNLLVVCALFLIGVIAGFARYFALVVQNRAARADERLRYYILTQKMLPPALHMGQILALRFASDEEFPLLVERTLKEQLSPTAIKKAVKNWRADHDRV
jgi:hypothetical protein